MKRLGLILKIGFFVGIMVFPGFVAGQVKSGNDSSGSIGELVKSQNYVFRADRVLPLSGPGKILTTPYDLYVSEDTIRAWLPYFGRAYQAPTDPARGGIKFTSTQFNYRLTQAKKGGWEVSIKPEDVRDVQQLTLHISEGGSASLHVISTHRQAISFIGKIIEKGNR